MINIQLLDFVYSCDKLTKRLVVCTGSFIIFHRFWYLSVRSLSIRAIDIDVWMVFYYLLGIN